MQLNFWKLFEPFITRTTPFSDQARSCLSSMPILAGPPLYYTTLHCRVHCIRLGAIKLLRALPSKEGIWNAIFVASVAEEIMQIEEGDYYKDTPVDDDFPLKSPPQDQDLSLPTLPASRRVHDVQVVLPDSPSGKAVLNCKRNKSEGGYEVITKEYVLGPPTGIAKEECNEDRVLTEAFGATGLAFNR
ncbi:uncharacterized protein BCR38DRAFT_30633 [Pseudomassariella vexata]|uniref:Uncharacterized protein n=1 Tax=Pseudomassariella vexata TaxID=1141098 RepID=A0A1Y2DQ06_9PEZI|nr:uncharacterized protein BCR38DRAFT_30633 [Pseudomassariella vexata]ORY61259.1 hypothetical protein BCR38DRAFT_30633 [Pseudomassariella vexata]